MYTGLELASAIREAIARKMAKDHISRDDIAKHFGIKTPSIYDWEKKGSVDKGKLTTLWLYFADVADMAHWGLSAQDFECFGLVPRGLVATDNVAAYATPRKRRLDLLLEAANTLSDSGIEHLTGYAIWLKAQYPKDKVNLAS
jgi:hypothetical protein